MATVNEVKNRALEELGKLRKGQSAKPADSTDVQNSYNEVYAVLKQLGVATWTSTAAIPAEVTPHVVALVAFNRATGVSAQRYARLQGLASVAIPGIRALTTPPHESLTDPDDF